MPVIIIGILFLTVGYASRLGLFPIIGQDNFDRKHTARPMLLIYAVS